MSCTVNSINYGTEHPFIKFLTFVPDITHLAVQIYTVEPLLPDQTARTCILYYQVGQC